MVRIEDKRNCCGCAACAQRCPKHCITMLEDEEGFLYPKVDADTCINCGLCEKVCPCLHQNKPRQPITLETAVNPDLSIRKQSSSGGVFSMLAVQTLNRGGVVFGARFNNSWEVEHAGTETWEGLKAFRGSKYVQSSIGDSFLKTESILKSGREVLFCGTPCQIAGLHAFLQKKYNNLLTVTFACHSVPSPLVWREYLKKWNPENIVGIQFRDKRRGWEHYGLSVVSRNGHDFFQLYSENPYMQLFLHGLVSRPSCFHCPAKEGKSGADIMIGDCWGLSQMLPDYPNDHQGTSFVFCQSERGVQAAIAAGTTGQRLCYERVSAYNSGLTSRSVMPKERQAFWEAFLSAKNPLHVIHQSARPYLPKFRTKLLQYCKYLREHLSHTAQ